MRILNNMKKAMLFVAASLFCSNVAFADTQTVYSWASPDGTPVETGGKIVYTNGDGNRLNYSQAGYYTICLNGKLANLNDETASANAGHMVLTLDEALQVGDIISITGFRNKNADGKDATIYFLFENGQVWKDTKSFVNVSADDKDDDYDDDGSTPNTQTWTITEAEAGSKTIKMTRNVGGTNLFLINLTITRETVTEPEQPAVPDSLIIGEETVLEVGKSYVLGKRNNMYKVKFTAEKDGFLSITPSQKVNSTGWKINNANSTFTKDANGGIDKKGMAAGSVFTGQFYCSADPSAENVYELVVTFEEGTPYSPLALTAANPANGGEWSGASQYKSYGTKGAAHFEFSTFVSANTVASIKVGEKVYSPVKLTVSSSSTPTLDVTAMADTLKKAAADGLIKPGDQFTLTLSNIVDKEFAANTLADQTFTYTMASTACTGVSPTASTSRSNLMSDVTFSFDGNVALADTAKFYLLNLFNNEKTALTGEIVDGTKVKVTVPAIEGLLPRRYNIVAEGVTTAEGDKVITYGNEPGKLVASYGTSNGFFKGTNSLTNWEKVDTLKGFTATYPAEVMKVDGIATKAISIKKVDSYLGTEEEIEGVTLKDSIDANNPNVIIFTVSPAITASGTYRLEVPQKHYWAKETYTEEDAKLSAPVYAYFQASITLTIDVEDPTLLNNLVDSLNALVVEVEAYQKTLDPNDATQASMIESLTETIALAKSAAEKRESTTTVNNALNELRNLYTSIAAYLAQMEVQAAEAVMAEFENPTDNAGLAAAINKVYEIVSSMQTGLGSAYTVADLNAAVEAVKVAKEAFIVENTPAENNMAVVKSWDFAAMAAVNPDKTGMTYSTETVKVGGTDSNLGTGEYEGLAMQGANNFMLRPAQGGLYSANGGGRKVGVLDLVPGQVVTIVTSGECMSLADATTAEQVSVETVDGKTTYVYNIKAEGMLALNMTRYFTIFSITVEQQVGYIQAAYWDFAAMAAVNPDKTGMTYSTETVKVGGTDSNLGTGEYEGLAMQGANNFMLRPAQGGLYSANGGGRKVGVLNMTKGSVITIVTSGECMSLADATVAEQTSMETADGKTTYVYTMTGDGILALSMTRYFTIYTIEVQQMVKYVTAPNWDFAAMAAVNPDKTGMTYSTETVKVGGTDSNLGTGEYEGLAMQGANNFMLRPAQGGLYSANGGGRKVGVLNMTKGSVITIVTSGECMSLADATVAEQTSMETADGKTTYVYTMTGDGILALNMTRYFTIFSINVLAVQPDIKAPTIEATGNQFDVMTVSLACETEKASIYYTINGGEEILYTEPFQISETSLIAAYSTDGKAVSKVTEKEVVAGFINVPTATITGVNGLDRTVTLACAVDSAAIVYKTAEEAEYAAYTAPFVISDTTTVWAIASKVSAVADTLTFVSDTMKVELAAGTEIRLAAPTFAKAAVDSLTNVEYQEKGLAAYLIAADQSSVLCTPTATINYEFYAVNPETGRISETPTLSGEYSDTLKALPYGKLVAKASAVGYAGSEAYTWLKAPAALVTERSYNFSREAWGGHTEDLTVTIGATAVDNVNGTDFGTLTIADQLVEGFLVQTGTSWLKRGGYDGFYQFNSGGRSYAIANVKRNQVVTVYGHAGNADFSQTLTDNGVAVEDVANTVANSVYTYRVVAPGTIAFNIARYGYIDSVLVSADPSVTKDVEYSYASVNGTSRDVAITCATLGADIYYSLGEETIEERLELDSLDKVVIVRDTTLTFSEYQLYTEPITISKNTYFRAYATYQDVDSDPVEFYALAGTDVQLAQPVIKYEGNTAEGLKMFTISVDNSEVVAAPACDIYYTMPGAEEVLYANDTIKVAADVYGWMSAVAKKEGYLNSAVARRYLDSRESYTETYRVIDNTTETMYDELGDVEIDYSEDIDVVQEAMVTAKGRVYLHRKVEGKVMNVVMPFLFNAKAHATDETGKVLERGVDYKVYKINASNEQCTEVHTGNVVAGAQGYLVEVLCDAEEIIFVSNGTAVNLGIAQTTFNQPATGYAVKTNKLFQPVVLECAAYLLNAEGTAFEQVPAGTEVAPFQACIMADNTILASVTSIAVDPKNVDGIYGLDNEGKEIETIKYITVSGVEVETPEAGVHIQQIIFKDGSTKTVKVVTK